MQKINKVQNNNSKNLFKSYNNGRFILNNKLTKYNL